MRLATASQVTPQKGATSMQAHLTIRVGFELGTDGIQLIMVGARRSFHTMHTANSTLELMSLRLL